MSMRLMLWTKSMIKSKLPDWIEEGGRDNEVDNLDKVHDKVSEIT